MDGAHPMSATLEVPAARTAGRAFHTNPIPAAMVGIGVVGLAWLAVDAARRRSQQDRVSDRSQVSGRTGGEGLNGGAPLLPIDYTWNGEPASGYTPGLAYGGGDPLRGLLRSNRNSFSARVDRWLRGVSRTIRQESWRSQDRVQYWFGTNPLLAGAIAAVLGGVMASALTEAERRSQNQ
jgi:hypothetical protein